MSKVDDDWLARLHASQSAAQRRHDPCANVVFHKGEGSRLWTVDGLDWIDLTCGYSATNFGHAYAPLLEVAHAQLSTLTHLTGDAHTGRIELAERLLTMLSQSANEIAPVLRSALTSASTSPNKVIFNATGARAIETAWKVLHQRRPGKLLVVSPDFHGRSIATGCLSFTARAQVSGGLEPQVHTSPLEHYPYCGQCPLATEYPKCQLGCATPLLRWIEDNHPALAGILLEPTSTARGYLTPPVEFFHRLRKTCNRYQLPIAVDEVQTGLGRLATFSQAFEQGWEPDLLVLGKSLGGGIAPISATLGPGDWLDGLPAGSESETFAATPLACAVSLKVLDLLQHETLVQAGWNAAHQLRTLLRELSEGRFQVEGQGGACALEFANSFANASVAVAQAHAIGFVQACAAQRLKVQLSGPRQTRVVFLPALTITEEEQAEASRRIRAAFHLLA